MANALVLGILQLAAVASCLYGLAFLWFLSGVTTIYALSYGSVWFILGFISNAFGLLGIVFEFLAGDGDDASDEGYEKNIALNQMFVQHHFLFAWLTVVVGYPCIVTQAWAAHIAGPWGQIHLLLMVLPMIAWMSQRTSDIVRWSQITIGIAVASHLYIAALAGDFWGVIAAVMMVVNGAALSIPTKYNLLGFSAREACIIMLALTSLVISKTVPETSINPRKVTELVPAWAKGKK
jgi:hypothetical protein